MRKLLIACLNLLLVFNSIGFQAINATEVDPPNEETYEPSLPTEETNSDDSIKENTDTDLPTEENINTVDDSINEEAVLEINDSVEDEQISTLATNTVEFLDKEKFRNNFSYGVTNLYFGTESDYDLSKCTQTINIGNNYTLYMYKDNSTYDAYVICQDGKQIFFPEDSSSLFSSKSSLQNITFKHIDTSYVKNMSKMFSDCKSLTTLDLSNFNTKNVTNMKMMFNECLDLTSLDVSNFNTENVTDMSYMFTNCSNLPSIKLSNFNTENVTDMNMMFGNCENLSSIDLSSFNTENVTNMSYMFAACGSLSSIDLSSFNTDNVTNMGEMFMGSDKLSSIDLSNFNTCNVTDMYFMFNHCDNLRTIYASNLFDASKSNSKGMFNQCTNLIGGLGTKFDSSKTNYEYAHIDGGTSNPGYFSCKHTWDSGVVTTEPTCVNKGIKTFKCTKCDATKTEDIAALGHELTHVTKKDATTEEFGNIEYWNCSKCKENFSDSEGTNEITGSTVIPKLAPSIIKGDNQSVTEKEEKALSVTSNASYDDFIEVKVDGTTLDISKYTKAKGSTIITLNSDYVSTLSVGTHTLDVVSKFGTATAHFKVEKKVEITPTPETNKSSTTDKASNGWDDGGPFTTDKCGNVFDRWNNKIYEANGCNVGGYNLVRTSVVD